MEVQTTPITLNDFKAIALIIARCVFGMAKDVELVADNHPDTGGGVHIFIDLAAGFDTTKSERIAAYLFCK